MPRFGHHDPDPPVRSWCLDPLPVSPARVRLGGRGHRGRGGGTTGGDGDGDGDGDGGQEITLDFEARINGAPFACGNAQGLGNAASDVDITDLRMFISDVQLTSGDGETVDAPIVSDDTWAQARVALLDFESSCGDAGSAGTNASFTVSVPEGTYTGVSFNLGLPFDLNLDASSPDSAAPLNTAALFWSWQGGYKFFRLDMKVGADATPWNVHLGARCACPTAR